MLLRTRLFLILFMAGFAGVLSLLLVDFSSLLTILPRTDTAPVPPVLLKLLSMIQPTILLAAATFAGVSLAPKVDLFAPAFEALARREDFIKAVKPQMIPGLIGGLVGATSIILIWVLVKPSLPPEFVMRAEELNRFLPFPTRILYGGLTEELLLRWGVMTFLVWTAWRLFQKGKDKPRTVYVVAAILFSSLLFGLGHLPVAFALGSRVTLAVVLYIVTANSVFGLIAGYLYWRRGLEAAMIAHMLAHVVIVLGTK